MSNEFQYVLVNSMQQQLYIGWIEDVYFIHGIFTMICGVVEKSSNGEIQKVSDTFILYGGAVYNAFIGK